MATITTAAAGLAALLIFLVCWLLAEVTGNIPQWVALGIGVYVVFSWAQSLKARDVVTYHMIFKTRAMVYTMLAFPTISFVTYGVGYWTAPLLLRMHDTSATEVGMYIGLGNALGGLIGVTLGGMLGDRFKARHGAGRAGPLVVAVLDDVWPQRRRFSPLRPKHEVEHQTLFQRRIATTFCRHDGAPS